ncbi:MAG: hypothetical protein PHW18_11590 [Sulfuricurvum sp.]|uniref:hypothetical protein n=1 Tax=Sulfuricurvum sp. TaxID=2025608 RepID=UPI00260214C2|nr:hypothetical protein [Sulfuricurvum sp.]MDD2830206.1 hypothetical protein [Sulfuricurvum sp.]MDD4949572.1 hypothetical protein [Sulfuricurvum sp.]
MSVFSSNARLLTDIGEIEQYRRILDSNTLTSGVPHWTSMGKTTITLFQVLIDQDLTHLVMVLRHYPQYIEAVCEHFRYAYSYSENSADIDAASELLRLGEPYFTKQFVRNVIRKLPRLESDDRDAMTSFIDKLIMYQHEWHPIITIHYRNMITSITHTSPLHPLQRIVVEKKIASIHNLVTYDYTASDRDSHLDIPYMN